MKKNMKIMTVLAVASVATAANAQTSILYLTDHQSHRIQAYQGGVQLWDQPIAYGLNEAPIAVVDNTIRTIGLDLGQVRRPVRPPRQPHGDCLHPS